MGNSTTNKPATPSSARIDVLANLAAATGGAVGGGTLRTGCAEAKLFRFVDGRVGELRVGLKVGLAPADLGQLVADDSLVARLDAKGETYVRACAKLGYTFSGSIRSLDPSGHTGTVELEGRIP